MKTAARPATAELATVAAPPVASSAAAPANTSPTPTPTPGGAITSDREQLATRDVAYNKPNILNFGEPTPVQVVINVTGEPIAGSFENLPGDLKTHPILVSREMTAELTGPADRVQVQLRPGFQPWQKVTTVGNPTWIWDITALAPGTTRLDLAIKARVDGGSTEQVIRTYHDTIPVKMGAIDAAKWWIAQIDPIWKWIIGVATALGAAVVWWRTNLARRKP